MRNVIMAELDEEYPLTELTPTESDTPEAQQEITQVQEDVGSIPETECMKMRLAILEAILDESIQNDLQTAQDDGKDITSPEVKQEVSDNANEIVDTAVTLHLVPSVLKKRIPELVNRQVKQHDPKYRLLQKAAMFLADRMVEADASVVEKVLDTKPADDGADIVEETPKVKQIDMNNTDGTVSTVKMSSFFPTMVADIIGESELDTKKADIGEAPVEEEVESTKPIKTSEGDPAPKVPADTDKDERLKLAAGIPDNFARPLRCLAASMINTRRNTACVSRRISGVMLADMLHLLRNHLPDSFKNKYGVR